jgi:hypothetical protein|tara:strand:- start:104 stop:634 length:531 start_codon:yes stop_codon:yes gene_type:complete
MANGTLKVGEITTSTGSGNITIGSGVTLQSNVPAFEAYLSSDQSVSDNVTTKVQVDTEVFDSDDCYDNSTNYRFTPTKAGKYFVYAKVSCDVNANSAMSQMMTLIYKNGSVYSQSIYNYAVNFGREGTPYIGTVIDMNGTTDYLELFGQNDVSSGSATFNGGTQRFTLFGAYKVGI